MWTISREYMFSAAHRLEGHPKCGRMHGHNYDVSVLLASDSLGDEGWIMDYAQLDAIVKPIIEELDHRYIVSQENITATCPYWNAGPAGDLAILGILRSTAECLAQWLAYEIRSTFELMNIVGVDISVQIQETPKSGALFIF